MRAATILLVCFMDFVLAHIDEVWKHEEAYTQNIVFFSCMGLRLALFMVYSLIIAYKLYEPNRWQLKWFSVYGIIAIFEYFKFVINQ